MNYQMIFKRHEIKYLLTKKQKISVLEAMKPHMALDQFGRTTIRNIYFDTDSYRLIRRSIEKPAYKEKIRLRSYAHAFADDPVFIELKKKYQSVVYKRRDEKQNARMADRHLRSLFIRAGELMFLHDSMFICTQIIRAKPILIEWAPLNAAQEYTARDMKSETISVFLTYIKK